MRGNGVPAVIGELGHRGVDILRVLGMQVCADDLKSRHCKGSPVVNWFDLLQGEEGALVATDGNWTDGLGRVR